MHRTPSRTDLPTAAGAALLSFTLILCGMMASRGHTRPASPILEHAQLEVSVTTGDAPLVSDEAPPQKTDESFGGTYQKN